MAGPGWASKEPPSSEAGVSFGWEKVADFQSDPDAHDLIFQMEEHVGMLFSDIPMVVDWKRMRDLEAAGMYRLWVAREADAPATAQSREAITLQPKAGLGRIVGWIEFQIQTSTHRATTLFATDCGHWVDPSLPNRGWVWIKMWREALPALKKLGVRRAVAHDSVTRPLGGAFERLGFRPTSTFFVSSDL